MTEYTISSKFKRARASDKTFIYALICPIQNDFFYVGRTSNPRERLEAHVHNHEYLIELAKHEQEYTIRMIILEELTPEENADERETYWILKTLERGVQLRNKSYPMGLNHRWISWLSTICDTHGWDSQITHNNRVKHLPIYGV